MRIASYSRDALGRMTSISHEGQVRTFAYDGYGRLKTRTTPEQGITNYFYCANDTMNYFTDARGVTTVFTYNGRQQVLTESHGVPQWRGQHT